MVPLARMKPLLVMNVVGLTPGLLRHTPRLAALGRAGFTAPLGTLLPAVTCPTQATMLTTGWPISSRRRASTGIATTGCLRRITSSGGPSRRSRSGTSASGATPRPAGMGATVTARKDAATRTTRR
ncbi:MAG: hypothetical protein DWI27_00310 [Planctomycetota bacterium]|nr:MAG: hypothetical protein DWI27_00310 [Planctomycetota bacterium]